MNERFAPVGGGTVSWRNYIMADGKHVDATLAVLGEAMGFLSSLRTHYGSANATNAPACFSSSTLEEPPAATAIYCLPPDSKMIGQDAGG